MNMCDARVTHASTGPRPYTVTETLYRDERKTVYRALCAGDARLEPVRASLRIRDHGIGISPELRPRLFGRFERGVSAS
jgi:signal transduction histidine kinase